MSSNYAMMTLHAKPVAAQHGNDTTRTAQQLQSAGGPTLREKIMPARGPRSDLCVVVVTMSQ